MHCQMLAPKLLPLAYRARARPEIGAGVQNNSSIAVKKGASQLAALTTHVRRGLQAGGTLAMQNQDFGHY